MIAIEPKSNSIYHEESSLAKGNCSIFLEQCPSILQVIEWFMREIGSIWIVDDIAKEGFVIFLDESLLIQGNGAKIEVGVESVGWDYGFNEALFSLNKDIGINSLVGTS